METDDIVTRDFALNCIDSFWDSKTLDIFSQHRLRIQHFCFHPSGMYVTITAASLALPSPFRVD